MGQKTTYLFLFCCLFICVIGLYLDWFQSITPQNIKAFVLSFGSFAPIVFILLFSLTPFAPFFSAVLAVASGLIFGFVYGSVLVMIGATCSSTVGFYLARSFSSISSIRQYKNNLEKTKGLVQKLNQNGFLLVFVLRLIPIVPFDVISYMAGFSTLRYKHYFIATVFGMLPGVLVYANIGANTLDIYSKEFVVSLLLLMTLTLSAFVVKKRLQKNWPGLFEKN